MITLRQLRYFVEIVDTGNITEAADRLHVAQTAVGQQIRKLEDSLGARLLERHSRGVSATVQGQFLYDRARQILAMVQDTADMLSDVESQPATVVLGITPSIARLTGPDIALAANAQLKTLRLHLVEELSFVLLEALHRQEIDYALAYEVANHPRLERIPLIEERLLFVEAPSGRDVRPIAFRDAVASDLALNGSRDIVWRMIHETADRLSLPVNAAFEVQSVEAIKTLVSRGVATTIMPFGIVAEELEKGLLVGRPIERPLLTRTLFLTQYRDRRTRINEKELWEFLDQLTSQLLERIGPLANRISTLQP